ncbi:MULTISPECIES: winged helix-turn-helix transcriptional regulator [Haloprofundus]|uniref:winged helix-turn-helix transcriptional regulator n=1 Tax=Haloprofundus TaxID=1911573 RepID=UPI000E435CE5|nr:MULTISPECIES: winged helix-turn-helix transcriptional regulator [Haloprofundus]QCJ48108.1 winged helix-turn-helix transcriptional regulator [Haloprofundus sp. MHR1]
MSATRSRIAAHVHHNPGVHFNELVRALDLAPGQVQYHLRRLGRDERVAETHLYGKTHYYPSTFDEWERGVLALVRRETARDVLGVLLERDEATPAEVADEVGIARSTLAWHTKRLEEQSVVEKRYDSRGRVTLALARPEATARLLASVSPSLPERFVDRFTRLVDGLLEP